MISGNTSKTFIRYLQKCTTIIMCSSFLFAYWTVSCKGHHFSIRSVPLTEKVLNLRIILKVHILIMCKIQDSGYTYRGKVFKETKFQSKSRWLSHQEIIHVSQDAQHVKVSKILQRREKKRVWIGRGYLKNKDILRDMEMLLKVS